MASKKFEKGSIEWSRFVGLWSIAQEYAIPEPTDDFWQSIADRGAEYISKYEKFDEQLAKDLFFAWHRHLERIQNGNTQQGCIDDKRSE